MTNRPRRRDKEATQHKILQALERVIARDGLHRVGINSVAREAGVDKVLVYRYFGGLPELIEVYANRLRLWPSFEEVIGTNTLGAVDLSAEELLYRYLSGLVRELRKRPFTLEVLRCEIIEPNHLTKQLSDERKTLVEEILAYLNAHPDAKDTLESALWWLTDGIIHTHLRRGPAAPHGRDDSNTDKTLRRLARAVVESCLSS